MRALVRYNSRNERGTLDWLDPDVAREVEVVLGDLRDVESVARAIDGHATSSSTSRAQIAIPYSYVNPRDFFETNVARHAQRRRGARCAPASRRVVHTSTSEVYGTARIVPIDRGAPARAAVAVRGEQGRRRQADGLATTARSTCR